MIGADAVALNCVGCVMTSVLPLVQVATLFVMLLILLLIL